MNYNSATTKRNTNKNNKWNTNKNNNYINAKEDFRAGPFSFRVRMPGHFPCSTPRGDSFLLEGPNPHPPASAP